MAYFNKRVARNVRLEGKNAPKRSYVITSQGVTLINLLQSTRIILWILHKTMV